LKHIDQEAFKFVDIQLYSSKRFQDCTLLQLKRIVAKLWTAATGKASS